MKRSFSELAFQEFISNGKTMTTFSTSDSDAAKPLPDHYDIIVDPHHYPAHVISDFKHHHDHQEVIMNDSISSYEREAGETHVSLLSQNLTPKRSTLDSQSSISGNLSWGTPVSAGNHPKSRGATSASSDHDQSDDDEEEDDDLETDAGQCEQSLDPSNLKRLRRMLSNRESARRSRKRKYEHLVDLELQAGQLRGENDSLYKQLTSAHQQFRDADTNNRVLKSDVEALRANVKLAEDMLTRGTFTCGLNQLLQSHLTSPQPIDTHNLRRVANVSPTINVHGDDSSYSGLTVSCNSPLGLAHVDLSNGNLNDGMW